MTGADLWRRIDAMAEGEETIFVGEDLRGFVGLVADMIGPPPWPVVLIAARKTGNKLMFTEVVPGLVQ